MTTPPEPPAVPEPTAQPVASPPPAAQPAPQYAAQPAPAAPAAPATTSPYPHTWMNIVSLVTAILGLSILGIIFGHLGVARANRGTADLKGLGIAGLILGYLGLAITIIAFVVIVVIGVWLAENCVTVDGVAVCD